MKVKVKICGIRTIKAAHEAVINGADFLGFNFVPDSRHFIHYDHAREIIETLSTNIKIVGVFRDEKIDEIKKIIKYLKLDFVQLHGCEGKEYSALTQYAGVIKTISVSSNFDTEKTIEMMGNYDVDYFLFDREIQGEGLPLTLTKLIPLAVKYPPSLKLPPSPKWLRRPSRRASKIFLAGGLTAENVSEAVHTVRPFAVDVASGIETDGNEDMEKIKAFIKNAKGI